MKILFITPYPYKSITFSKVVFSSLTLKQLAAITPNNHDVKLIDEKFQKINFQEKYDVVGISLMTYNSLRGYEIADEFRRRGNIVVLGGYHPTALPHEAKQHADSVVIGEAEITWPKLLEDVEKGTLKSFYRATNLIDGEKIPSARHDLLKSSVDSIQISRGCPIGCKFCSIRNVEGSIYRTRHIDSIIEELKTINAKNIFFADSSLTIKPDFSKNIFKRMAGLNKEFTCFGNVNTLGKDEELLKLSSDAGCRRWLIGIESFNQKNINYLSKKSNKVEEYAKSIRKIKDYGIHAVGMFIFGFDADTLEVFDNTLEEILKLDLDSAFFNILTPYPGTDIFYDLDISNRIITRDWSKYLSRAIDQSVVFQPKNMTPEQLSNRSLDIAKEYYSFSNILGRCINSSDLNLSRLIKKFYGNISTKMAYNKITKF